MLQMPNRRSARLMNCGRAPIPELAEPNGGRGGNNRGRGRGRGGIPFNLENTPPPAEENIPPPPPPPPNLAEVMAQQAQLLASLVNGANRR